MKLIASVANAKLSIVSTSGEKLVDISYDNYALEVDVANIINEAGVIVALAEAAKQKFKELDHASYMAHIKRQNETDEALKTRSAE